jgi:NAD(P)-dependent dehydrogenase (short-subunit alcohol dehydrogenase family)
MPPDARDAIYAAVAESLPVGRVGQADEIAQAVIMAMTNGFLTGAVLDIDGGHLVRG